MAPIRLALVNDYELVVEGLAALLERDDRFLVVDITTDDHVNAPADVALYDTFGAADPDFDTVRSMLADSRVTKTVVFTWAFDRDQIDKALDLGVAGYLSKALPADDLGATLHRIHLGETVVSDPPSARSSTATGRRWPGQAMNLTEKEADVLALISQGHDNRSIADMLCISPNTLKTRVRHLYRKIGADTRVQAVIWGVRNGFEPDNAEPWETLGWRS